MTTIIESPLGEAHRQAGASMGVWFGTRLPADYGDFDAEYRRARSAVAILDTNFQTIADLVGPDRVRYLNAITTANIRDLESGSSVLGLILNAQAHILAELRTLAISDRLMILSHAMVAERTLATLEKFIIMDDVTLADRSGEFGTLALVGPAAVDVTEEVTGLKRDALPEGAHTEARAGSIPCRIIRACSLRLAGVEWVVERSRLGNLWHLLVDAASRRGGGLAGYRAIEALRVESGFPWFGADFDDRAIPHEARVEQSHISYTKGCYSGQEIVERVRTQGQVNRRLTGLGFIGTGVPERGAALFAGEETVGRVTSATFSPLAQRVVGLGYLRREFRAPGNIVRWEHGQAEVIALPLAGAMEG